MSPAVFLKVSRPMKNSGLMTKKKWPRRYMILAVRDKLGLSYRFPFEN